ncbi:MAG: c-type cytochrome domain-containing protein, partial [Verrucomicrobiota bacterium]|nr:c-type cytochrome domain-containing protein [Verrucomicrobiota bacterium]
MNPKKAILISCFLFATCLAAAPVDFAREVLPILSNKCFVCHGPDGEAKKTLRLDSFAEATRDLDGYKAIDPAAPEKSEIIVRLH